MDSNVELPAELHANREQIEDYVRKRIVNFARQFAEHAAPQLSRPDVDELVQKIVKTQQPANSSEAGADNASLELQLTFKHDCLAIGCRDNDCSLCQYNPNRLCEREFGKKYLVGDVLKAKCGAPIKVEVTDKQGKLHSAELPGLHLEVALVDGVAFKDRGGDGKVLSEDELKSCFKLTNHREEALLQHKAGSSNSSRRVVLKLEAGQAVLPDLQSTDSSEALLTGRRPPFRLVVYAADAVGSISSSVRYTASEEFVVATRRVKQANKADIPLVDDHVSKIEHIGRETVKKLVDLQAAAGEMGVEVVIPPKLSNITTVGQFQQLVMLSESNSQMRKVLQLVLKLSKEKWDEAAAHAMQAVQPDFRKRVWYPPGHNMGIGILFNCKYGAVCLKDSVALLQLNASGGGSAKIISEDHLDTNTLGILRQLKAQAISSWWKEGHPGWTVFREQQPELPGKLEHQGMEAAAAAGAAARRSPSSGFQVYGPGMLKFEGPGLPGAAGSGSMTQHLAGGPPQNSVASGRGHSLSGSRYTASGAAQALDLSGPKGPPRGREEGQEGSQQQQQQLLMLMQQQQHEEQLKSQMSLTSYPYQLPGHHSLGPQERASLFSKHSGPYGLSPAASGPQFMMSGADSQREQQQRMQQLNQEMQQQQGQGQGRPQERGSAGTAGAATSPGSYGGGSSKDTGDGQQAQQQKGPGASFHPPGMQGPGGQQPAVVYYVPYPMAGPGGGAGSGGPPGGHGQGLGMPALPPGGMHTLMQLPPGGLPSGAQLQAMGMSGNGMPLMVGYPGMHQQSGPE